MKSTFVSACLISAAIAGPRGLGGRGKLQNSPNFVNFMAKNNKHYTNTAELGERAGLFAAAENEVGALNARSARSGLRNAARFETNALADLTQVEKDAKLGLVVKDGQRATRLYNNRPGQKGRKLVADATNVDLAADGFMHAVKDQGSCGSCYAFAANTAIEGFVAKRDNATPVHLSEQHIVDCTSNKQFNQNLFGRTWNQGGCGGGWMATVWDFNRAHGSMLESDYPYLARETQCEHDASKVVGKVTKWGRIMVSDGIQGVKDKVATHPLTIAINASSGTFQYYKSGVVAANSGCPTGINHAVVIVGYTSSGDDSGPGPDPEPEPPVENECTVTKWWHSCEGDDRRQLQDANGLDNYWKIQNSWASWWGDQGFILFEIAEGKGVCGMNQYVEWVEM